MNTVIQLIKSSFRQLLRDKTAMFFTFAFPIVFMVIFGLIFSGSENYKADIGFAGDTGIPEIKAVEQAFKGVPAFVVSDGNLDELMAKLKRGDLAAVISVPEDTSISALSTEPVVIKIICDPSNTTTTQVVLPIAQQVIEQIDRQVSNRPSVISMEVQSIQAHNMRAIDYLVPGIIAMSLLSTGLFCAMPIIQQRAKKILKRWSVTPIQRSSIIYSQVIFRVVLALLQTAILIILASAVFGVNMLGNWFELAGIILLGTLMLISVGYVIASFVRTEEGAMPVIQLVQFPMMFLSGIFFPVSSMPAFMKPVLQAMPLSYLGDALRQVMVQGTPMHAISLDVAVIGGVLIVCMAISIRFFRWE
ncbi:MAG TPA: ABC transporter permease [Dehalococcoidales bacterium]|nr:ABC transporter permease [Dehalococcoidales bacterium]